MKKIISSLAILLISTTFSFADVATKNVILQDEGTTVSGAGRILNFTGGGVAVTFAGGKYVITIDGGGSVSDTAYGISWSTVTDVAASKKSLYDKIETLGAGMAEAPEDSQIYGRYNATWTVVSGGISLSDLSASNPIVYNNGTGAISWTNSESYITQADIDWTTNLASYETDPVFSASVAAGISAGDITNWTTAYSWGDWSGEGFITQATWTSAGVTWAGNDIALTTNTSGNYVASVATTAPLSGGAAGSEGATLTLSIPKADTSTNGYLWSTDWNTFNDKMAGTLAGDLVTTAPITGGVNDIFPGSGTKATIAISKADTSTNGYLWSTDWTTFNAKAAANQTFYIGTTQVAINRASAALTLAGITLTTPDIGTPSAGVLTSCTGTASGLTAGTATTANAGDSATAFFSTGTIEGNYGGTGQNSSTWTGMASVANGTWTVREESKSFVITGTIANTSDFGNLWKTPYALTIRSVNVTAMGGAASWSIVGHLDECDANGANCAGVDGATDITCTQGTNAADDGTLSNPSIDANDWIGWHTTSQTWTTGGSVGVTFKYDYN